MTWTQLSYYSLVTFCEIMCAQTVFGKMSSCENTNTNILIRACYLVILLLLGIKCVQCNYVTCVCLGNPSSTVI